MIPVLLVARFPPVVIVQPLTAAAIIIVVRVNVRPSLPRDRLRRLNPRDLPLSLIHLNVVLDPHPPRLHRLKPLFVNHGRGPCPRARALRSSLLTPQAPPVVWWCCRSCPWYRRSPMPPGPPHSLALCRSPRAQSLYLLYLLCPCLASRCPVLHAGCRHPFRALDELRRHPQGRRPPDGPRHVARRSHSTAVPWPAPCRGRHPRFYRWSRAAVPPHHGPARTRSKPRDAGGSWRSRSGTPTPPRAGGRHRRRACRPCRRPCRDRKPCPARRQHRRTGTGRTASLPAARRLQLRQSTAAAQRWLRHRRRCVGTYPRAAPSGAQRGEPSLRQAAPTYGPPRGRGGPCGARPAPGAASWRWRKLPPGPRATRGQPRGYAKGPAAGGTSRAPRRG